MENYLQNHSKCRDLFQASFQKSWLDDRFIQALELLQSNSPLDTLVDQNLITEIFPNVFSLPVFTPSLCNLIIEEAESFLEYAALHDLAVYRPNSMNKYGLVLNQMGMQDLLTDFQQQFLLSISRALYPVEASHFTGHHSFIVSYSPDKDRTLDMHTDDSDVTWNICLGKEGFVGSGLTFCGAFMVWVECLPCLSCFITPCRVVNYCQCGRGACSGQPPTTTGSLYAQDRTCGRAPRSPGMIIAHAHTSFTVFNLLMQFIYISCFCSLFICGRQRHGADEILAGERHNLIMWSKNNVHRESKSFEHAMRTYTAEEAPPDPLCLSFTHDRDYLAFREYPPGSNPYHNLEHWDQDDQDADSSAPSLPWCPPAKFGYPGMLSHNKLMLLHFEREAEREDRERKKARLEQEPAPAEKNLRGND